MRNRKYHYTYLIRDLNHNKVYYGVHSTDYDPEDITVYHGSSKHLNAIITAFNFKGFTKEVRKYFKTRQQANKWESTVLRRMKITEREDFYNQKITSDKLDASGYTVVRRLDNGSTLRVPVGDPYINVLYESIAKGVKLSQEARDNLRELRKGKWTGSKNPVHNQSFTDERWREIHDANSRKPLTEPHRAKLRYKASLNRNTKDGNSDAANERHKLHRKYNPHKGYKYLYNKKIYNKYDDLPVKMYEGVVVLDEPVLQVNILFAEGKYYSSIKLAAKDLNLHRNTVSSRLNNTRWDNYYYLKEELLAAQRVILDYILEKALYFKYKELLLKSKEKPAKIKTNH